jgi:NAD(P)-dependent dehydrogenase (short-subunit alcohol dehydrogenase family)
MRVRNSVAVVTGASSGIGLLTAVELARSGYRVVAAMRRPEQAEELRRRAEEAGVASLLDCRRLDVTDTDGIGPFVDGVHADYGRIDVLVNNAGIAVGGFVEEVPMAAWREQMETNFFGLVAMTQAAVPRMRAQASGTIINIGSVSGLIAFPGYAPYAASKYAVEGFSESLRHELMPYGIRVIVVEPGSYRTSIWEKGLARMHRRSGSPYEPMLEAVLRFSRRAADTSPDPQEVAALIGRAAIAGRPRLRYPIGRGMRLLLLGKAVLPWRLLERIIGLALRR